MIERVNSVVPNDIINEFEMPRGSNLFEHSSNTNNIQDFISMAYVLCPDVIKINNYIFISDFILGTNDKVEEKVRKLEKRFNRDRTLIEKYVNSWSFGDFFIDRTESAMDDLVILKQFGDILVYYWTRRVKEVFPDENIIIEYGDEIMGELGLTITMYQI